MNVVEATSEALPMAGRFNELVVNGDYVYKLCCNNPDWFHATCSFELWRFNTIMRRWKKLFTSDQILPSYHIHYVKATAIDDRSLLLFSQCTVTPTLFILPLTGPCQYEKIPISVYGSGPNSSPSNKGFMCQASAKSHEFYVVHETKGLQMETEPKAQNGIMSVYRLRVDVLDKTAIWEKVQLCNELQAVELTHVCMVNNVIYLIDLRGDEDTVESVEYRTLNALDTKTATWSKVRTTSDNGRWPTARVFQSITQHEHTIFMIGGWVGEGTDEMWTLNVSTRAWRLLPTTLPSRRFDVQSVVTSQACLYIYGGTQSSLMISNDLYNMWLSPRPLLLAALHQLMHTTSDLDLANMGHQELLAYGIPRHMIKYILDIDE